MADAGTQKLSKPSLKIILASLLLALFLILAIAIVLIVPLMAHTAPGDYNPGDIAVINDLIDNNGLNWSRCNDVDGDVESTWMNNNWSGVFWTSGADSRIKKLFISFHHLTGAVDLNNLTNLTVLGCAGNNISTLDVSNLTNLTQLDCYGNNISVLDVSNLTNLTYLGCGSNNISILDVSNMSELVELACAGNHLTTIDLSGVSELESFVGSGQTATINLTGNNNSYSGNVLMNDDTEFGSSAITYSNGVITSTDKTVTSTTFTSPTGLDGHELSGELTFVYTEV